MKTSLKAIFAALVLGAGLFAGSAAAETLKFAHVYETSAPYHTWAVWAAQAGATCLTCNPT